MSDAKVEELLSAVLVVVCLSGCSQGIAPLPHVEGWEGEVRSREDGGTGQRGQ